MIQGSEYKKDVEFKSPKRYLWFFINSFFSLFPGKSFSNIIILFLRLFGAKIGKNVTIYNNCMIDFPWKIKISDNVTLGKQTKLFSAGFIEIGEGSILSRGTQLITMSKDLNDRISLKLRKQKIVIESNVWIGVEAIILPGTKVNKNVIIGARAVITKTIKDGIYVGNPARNINSNI